MPPRPNVPQAVVRDPYMVIPHVATFAGKYNVVNQSYSVYFDEALRDSQANTLAMRRDGFIHNLLRHRQLPVVCLPWSVVVEDPDDPQQKEIGTTVEALIRATPRLKTLKLYLLEALFYGKFASQVQYGKKRVRGGEYTTIVRHMPVNGDKLRYKWDGTPGIALYSGSQSRTEDQGGYLETYADDIESTMLGKALFLKSPFLRDRFIIHKFEPSDTDYLFEIDQSLSVHGLGLRSRFYWTWNTKVILLSWLMDGLQRVGVNGMIYGFYATGNMQARNETLIALKELVDKNIAVFPFSGDPGQAKDLLQKIDPAQVGYDVMMQLMMYLDDIMRQGFLGQDLSSQSKPTGLGGGAADLQGDVRTDYMEVDAGMLDETMTEDLLTPLLKYNQFAFGGQTLYGIDLPFSMRIESRVDRQGADVALQNAQALFNMGVDLDEDDLLDKSGLSAPKKPERAVVNHMLKTQEHQAGMTEGMAGVMKSATAVARPPTPKEMGPHAASPQRYPEKPSRMAMSKPEESLCLSGELYLSSSGWGLLKVPNALVRGLFDAMDDPDVSLPPQDSDADKFRLNAHISVLRPEEIESIGGPKAIEEWGQRFKYQIGPIKTVEPKDWDGMERVYFVDVDSPELEDMREKHGLTRLPNNNKYRFHINTAVKPAEKDDRYSRMAHAGEAGDCGHERKGGEFTDGNTCASGGGKTKEATDYLHTVGFMPGSGEKTSVISAILDRRLKSGTGLIFLRPKSFAKNLKGTTDATDTVKVKLPRSPRLLVVSSQEDLFNKLGISGKHTDNPQDAEAVRNRLVELGYDGYRRTDFPEIAITSDFPHEVYGRLEGDMYKRDENGKIVRLGAADDDRPQASPPPGPSGSAKPTHQAASKLSHSDFVAAYHSILSDHRARVRRP